MMIDRSLRLKNKYDDEMLEIFILLEENNYASSKQATTRYQALTGITNSRKAANELINKYKAYNLKTNKPKPHEKTK